MTEYVTVDTPQGPVRFPKGMSRAEMAEALNKLTASQPTGEVPADMFYNPDTGQMTSRELMREHFRKTEGGRDAVVRGAGQGVSLGFGDEISGLGGLVTGGPERQQYVTERERARNEAAQQDNPYLYGGGEIGGATVTALGSAPLATGRTMLGTMGRGAAIGATEGTVYGAGTGEEGTRLPNAIRMGTIGAGVGAMAPPAVGLAVKGGRGVIDALAGGFDAAVNRGSKGRATRAVMEALQRSGQSADDVARAVQRAATEGQPEFRVMDATGVAGRRLANSIARAGGDGSEEITQYLTQRQLDQGDRVARFVGDAFDGSQTAAQRQAAMKAARDTTADAAYSAARGNAAPVDVRGAVSVIDDRIGGMSGSNIAGDSIDGRLAAFRRRLIAEPAPEGEISRELSDFDRVLGVKQDVADAIGAATRAGRNNEARELTRLRNALDSALEDASPSYRAANDEFAAASRAISAVDEGADMAKPGARAADTTGRFSAMTPEEQAAARVGYGDRALAKIEANPAPTADKSRPFRSTKARQEADVIATDPRLFSSRIGREGEMWETQNRVLGGSRTADNLQDIQATGPLANIVRGLRAAGNVQFGEAASNFGNALSPYATGRNEATRKIIADMLMAADANDVLRPAERMALREQIIRRLLEGSGRAAGRELTP